MATEQKYSPVQRVNIGPGKDTLNDFARKYNLEIENIYDLLNKYTVSKVVFYGTSSFWSSITGGYRLSLPHNGNIVFAVYKTISTTESQQVLVGVSMNATNVMLDSVTKFDGYMLYAAINEELGIQPVDPAVDATAAAIAARDYAREADAIATALTNIYNEAIASGQIVAPAVDTTLTVTGAAADASVVGIALYRSKNRNSNTPAGLTFWRSSVDGYSNTNPFTPANIPVNSYTYVQGSGISVTDLALQSNAYYWVFCFASTYNSTIRRYRIVRVPTSSYPVPITYVGHTTNSGNAIRWATEEIDETLSVSGASADASVVGTALYRSKNRDSNTPAGLTFWRSSVDGYDSTNPFSPANMPGNTYTIVTGNATSGFSPDGTKLLDSGVYYIVKLQSTYNSSLGIILVYSLSGDRTFIGTANSGVYKFYGMPSPSIKIAYFGDSITRGINSDNYPGVNQYSEVNIPVLLNNETGFAVDNYGIGSIGWLENGGSTKGKAIEYLQRMGNADWYINGGSYANNKFVGNTKNWTNYNTVVLAFGANDRAVDGTGTVLGSLDDIDNTMTYEQVMAMTPTTIVEAMYQCYRYIREQAPTINIIISDPLIQRGGSAPEWSYPTRYSASRWSWYELCELYEAFARKYGCGHISNFDAPINRVDISTSLKDGVHPTTNCYYQLARHFAGKLSALV